MRLWVRGIPTPRTRHHARPVLSVSPMRASAGGRPIDVGLEDEKPGKTLRMGTTHGWRRSRRWKMGALLLIDELPTPASHTRPRPAPVSLFPPTPQIIPKGAQLPPTHARHQPTRLGPFPAPRSGSGFTEKDPAEGATSLFPPSPTSATRREDNIEAGLSGRALRGGALSRAPLEAFARCARGPSRMGRGGDRALSRRPLIAASRASKITILQRRAR